MGEVVLGALSPHPPLLIPDIGKADRAAVAATTAAMQRLSREIAEAKPDTVVVISPHAAVFSDAVALLAPRRLEGDLRDFGSAVRLAFENDLDFLEELIDECDAAEIVTVTLGDEPPSGYRARATLDHGFMVPLYFIDEALRSRDQRVRLVASAMAALPLEDLYAFGKALASTAGTLGRRLAVVASGDLSHRLTPHAPSGYDPMGKEFDRKFVELLGACDVAGIMSMDRRLVDRAGECGYRSTIMMLGALDGLAAEPEVLSYEGPFGVGYAVVRFTPKGPDPARRLLPSILAARNQKVARHRQNESPIVQLARQAVEAYVKERRRVSPPDPLPPEMLGRAGVFCSIKKHGQLRGCIGTIEPTSPNIATEVIRNAIAAATEDPRFLPVGASELAELTYSVDVLGRPEKVPDTSYLDPKRYGVIVRRGHRTGLLLPNLEGVETVEEQVSIARRKAGIGPTEPVELERFEVTRYT